MQDSPATIYASLRSKQDSIRQRENYIISESKDLDLRIHSLCHLSNHHMYLLRSTWYVKRYNLYGFCCARIFLYSVLHYVKSIYLAMSFGSPYRRNFLESIPLRTMGIFFFVFCGVHLSLSNALSDYEILKLRLVGRHSFWKIS